jgi:hypothetical protein
VTPRGRGRARTARAFLVLLGALLVWALAAPAPAAENTLAPSGTSASLPPAVASLAAALERDRVYRSPAAAFTIDAARLRSALPAQTYVAVLGSRDLPAGTQPVELPALLTAGIGQGGTVIVLLDRTLYGGSTLVPGALAVSLPSAQAALPPSGDATGALIALAQSVGGPADSADPTPPPRAGSPVGGAVLIAVLVALVAGGIALWWVLRRPARRRPRRRVEEPKHLVEVDYAGRIVRVTPASERGSSKDPGGEESSSGS